MTPAFFRRWLKREQEQRSTRSLQHSPVTQSNDLSSSFGSDGEEADPFDAAFQRRVQEVHEEYLRRSQMEGSLACTD